jgi:hypothetical protein
MFELLKRVICELPLNNNEYAYLIEIKATNTQHSYSGLEEGNLNHIKHHIDSLILQIEGLRYDYQDAGIFGILIGTCPAGIINAPDFMVSSCYSSPQNKSLVLIKEAYCNTVIRSIPEKIDISELVEIQVGEFYQVPVSLLVYLLKI